MNEISTKLIELIDDFKAKALAHYLHFESSERKLTQNSKNALKEEYGNETFMPSMLWRETFGNDLEDSDELDQAILEYLNSINYSKETFVQPKDRLKNMLWNNARSTGQKILQDLEV